MRKIESNFIASPAATSRLPSTDIHTILPRRATSITAPGTSPSSMCFCVTSSSRFSCVEERPAPSCFAGIGRMPASAYAVDAANNRATTLMDFFMAPSSREDLRQLRAARGLPPEGPGPSFTDVSEIEILERGSVAVGVAHDEAPAARHHLRRYQHLRFRLKLAPCLLKIVDDEDGVHLACDLEGGGLFRADDDHRPQPGNGEAGMLKFPLERQPQDSAGGGGPRPLARQIRRGDRRGSVCGAQGRPAVARVE